KGQYRRRQTTTTTDACDSKSIHVRASPLPHESDSTESSTNVHKETEQYTVSSRWYDHVSFSFFCLVQQGKAACNFLSLQPQKLSFDSRGWTPRRAQGRWV
ncbi:hypothetical protein AABB24_037515, partial [Solanum stoloniferum]